MHQELQYFFLIYICLVTTVFKWSFHFRMISCIWEVPCLMEFPNIFEMLALCYELVHPCWPKKKNWRVPVLKTSYFVLICFGAEFNIFLQKRKTPTSRKTSPKAFHVWEDPLWVYDGQERSPLKSHYRARDLLYAKSRVRTLVGSLPIGESTSVLLAHWNISPRAYSILKSSSILLYYGYICFICLLRSLLCLL